MGQGTAAGYAVEGIARQPGLSKIGPFSGDANRKSGELRETFLYKSTQEV
jgi:hypothetical protein